MCVCVPSRAPRLDNTRLKRSRLRGLARCGVLTRSNSFNRPQAQRATITTHSSDFHACFVRGRCPKSTWMHLTKTGQTSSKQLQLIPQQQSVCHERSCAQQPPTQGSRTSSTRTLAHVAKQFEKGEVILQQPKCFVPCYILVPNTYITVVLFALGQHQTATRTQRQKQPVPYNTTQSRTNSPGRSRSRCTWSCRCRSAWSYGYRPLAAPPRS